jgi:diguanylate cyclase
MALPSSRGREFTPDFAQDVIRDMLKARIEVTPKSFHVWFDYAMGWHPELAIAIESYQRRNQPLTTEMCETLYDKYIGTDRAQDVLAETQEGTHEILRDLLKDVLEAGGIAQKYGSELSAYSDELLESLEAGKIRDVVKGLVSETAKMAKSSMTLQSKLEQATDDVNALRKRLDQLEHESLTDPLTGLRNRKALERQLASCFAAYAREGSPFCLIMLDIDHFKSFNDKYGHHIGDAVLRIVSATLSDSSKKSAMPHRYGGEEFSVVLPNTALSTGIEIAEQYRAAVESKRLKVAKTSEHIEPITISLGVSEVRPDDNDETLLQRADRAMYHAKDAGRNAVKSERDLNPSAARATA